MTIKHGLGVKTDVPIDRFRVPFNKPVRLEEHEAVFRSEALRHCISGNGVFTKNSELLLSEQVSKPVRLVTSGTHALEMMALLVNISPGDEVIVPSFTFVSCANAFALRGAIIRFADNDDFGNIIPSEIERLSGPKTKAVVVVHYAGASADMDQILEICRAKNIFVLEDAAQAVGATYKGRALGTLGSLGCYSFHETKNITSGEGGALIFGDGKFVERAEILREKGTNRSRFLQGLADKYTWVDLGSSYVLSELNVAYLYPQVQRLKEINDRRQEIWSQYRSELSANLNRHDIQILETPSYNQANYHLFALIFQNQKQRSSFIQWMASNSIVCPFHYVSLHTSPFGRKFYSDNPESLPGCERLSDCLVRLPIYYNMTDDELRFVIEKTQEWLKK